MHEIEPKFELFGIAHAGAGNWILVDAAATEIARLGETRGTAREFKKCPEQSQNVAENKAHHFS